MRDPGGMRDSPLKEGASQRDGLPRWWRSRRRRAWQPGAYGTQAQMINPVSAPPASRMRNPATRCLWMK